MNRIRRAQLAALVAIVVAPGAVSAEDTWQVGSAPSFSSGRYGTSSTTEVLHTPFTARRIFADGDLTLVFPFTCISGDGSVTVVNGSPVRSERLDNARTTDGSTTTRGSGATRGTPATPTTPATPAPASSSACGMGDIVARGRYYVVDARGWVPTIALRGHVKLPTASAGQGLGTGQSDEGAGVEISRSAGRGRLLMVDGGYTFMGQPDGIEFNNVWWYDVGLGQTFAHGVLNLSAFFEEYRAIVPGLDNSRDILAALSITGSRGWRLQFSALIGLSDGAPDHGVTFGASRRF